MNSLKQTIKNTLLACLTTLVVCLPAWADDTEIYFGGNSTSNIRPNVLFILDTSGSMAGKDGTNLTRLERMQRAMINVLNSTDDINVGLMRFTNPGGPVVYPVKYINEVTSSTVTPASFSGSLNRSVSFSEDDAKENAEQQVDTTSDRLETETVASAVFETYIQSGSDDVEETKSSGSLNLSSPDLDLPFSYNNEQIIGVRLRDINVPKNATISNAYLSFQVRSQTTGDLNITIHGDKSKDADPFGSSNNLKKPSQRTKTSASVTWNITDSPTAGSYLQSADISGIVEEIVSQGGWSSGNDMVFLLEHHSGYNRRILQSYESAGQNALKLHVEYSTGGTVAQPQTLGLRFNEIAIPQGATITSASLAVSAKESHSGTANMVIWGEDADHSEAYRGVNGNISSRTKTYASQSWSIPDWTADTQYSTSGLTSIIQEIVNRPGWCGNNSLSLILEPNDGQRIIKSFDDSADQAPELQITYDTSSISSTDCYHAKRNAIIKSDNDDAEQEGSSMRLNGNALDLGEHIVGLRYQDIPLKNGADISHAYIEFAVRSSGQLPTSLTIYAQDTDDASHFDTGSNNISNRTKTTASVSWTPGEWNTPGQMVRTPNIAPLINEVVNRGGWTPDNEIVFMIEGSGHRIAESRNGSNLAPQLVYYAADADVDGAVVTVRDELIRTVQGLPDDGFTPIVDTLYEAALYYRGEEVDYGKTRGTGSNKRWKRVSHPGSYTGGTLEQPWGCSSDNLDDWDCAEEQVTGSPTYISPIDESCQRNYVVLLTDGEANRNNSVEKIKAMTGESSCADSTDGEKCGLELVNYLFNEDQSSALELDQPVVTHTIGLEFSTDWLAQLAEKGGGRYYTAESTEDLTITFDTLIRTILAANSTFVEPSVTINQFNRFAHRDDVYFALFKPQKTAQWYGNIKKYRLKGNPATLYDNDNPSKPAIDPYTGFFSIDSKSFWSEDVDGNEVENGGAAGELTATRKLYTNIDAAEPNLAASVNSFHEDNNGITKALLDIPDATDADRTSLMKWARGLDKNDAPRKHLGDPLHSRPELITYGVDGENIDGTIFFGTNEGFLHAVDINTGAEQFAFIPKELLPNLKTFNANLEINDDRPYGLDGGLTVWTRDNDNDNNIEPPDGDFARIYVGMRRGGNHYYALDVSNVNSPKQLWQIDGGSGDFADLGQTWSEPVKTKIVVKDGSGNGVITDVLVFAGGYDPDQDDNSVRTPDDQGNALFIVDATTGALIWSGGNHAGHDEVFADMDYSIPSDVTVIDINRDGLADQIYVGDMGGQVWRFDIFNDPKDNGHYRDVDDMVTGGVIADLAVDNSVADTRRFYYKPDLALIVDGKHRYLSLSIGSGYRAHPLNVDINDRFYMIKVFDTHQAPASYTKITESDLHDATDNMIMSKDPADAEAVALAEEELSNDTSISNRKQGWMIRLTNNGEKVLASSATIQNQVIFTTYEPTPPDVASCNPAQGTSRAYLVSVFDATPVADVDGDNNLETTDRVVQLQIGSIPSTPTVIDTVESDPTVWIGPERLDEADTSVESVRTYWIEEPN